MFSKLMGGLVKEGLDLNLQPGLTIHSVVGFEEEDKTTAEVVISSAQPGSSTQSISSTQPTSAIQSQLINREGITTYTTLLDKAKQYLKNNELEKGRQILLSLVLNYPAYPEAFVEFGDSYSKTKNAALAVGHYNTAIELAPFDVETQLKCTRQLQELSKLFPSRAVKLETLSTQLKEAKDKKNEEHAFRNWYHARLRHRLSFLNIICESPLSQNKNEKLDYQDLSLSNGAALECFKGLQSWSSQKFELAEYYFARAIIKFEHDFVAWGSLAFSMLVTDTIKSNQVQEVSKVIDKYHYSLAYFTRFVFRCEVKQDDLAYEDLCAFLCEADHPDFTRIESYRDLVLDFLLAYTGSQAGITERAAVEGTPESLTQVIEDILKNKFQGDIDKYIKMLNTLISHHPDMATNYCSRAMFYEHKCDYKQANINYSIAIWLAESSRLSSYFYYRAKINLKLGMTILADQDFERSLIFLKQNKIKTWARERLKYLQDFAGLCLKIGKRHGTDNLFDYAESVLNLGISKALQVTEDYEMAKQQATNLSEHSDVLANLYVETALIMQKKGLSLDTVRNYIFKSTVHYSHWQPESLTLLNSKLEYYLNKAKKHREKEKAIALQAAPVEVLKKTPAPKNAGKNNSFFKSGGRKPKSTSSTTRYIFSEEKPAGLEDLHLKSTTIMLPVKSEEEKKLEKKIKDKTKKLYRLQQRKQCRVTAKDSSSESDSEDYNELQIKPLPEEDKEIDTLTFTDFEAKIFAMIFALVPEEIRKDYKIFLGGGWAYDKIRLKLLGLPINIYNDFDVITNIPPAYFKPPWKSVLEVSGLFSLIVDDVKIDVVFEEKLDNLARIAKDRDFLSLFIDEKCKVNDPTGFGLINLRKQQLYSALPPSEIFKDDPLRIFRALYQKTKRDLHLTTIKKQIKAHSHLLVPRKVDPQTGAADKIFHPHRFNSLLGRLFSQHMAERNFHLLDKFNLLEMLFPDLYGQLSKDMDWIESQMHKSSVMPFPKVSIIYATLIASAIAQRIPVIVQKNKLVITKPFLNVATNIYENSKLFQDAFANVNELCGYLLRSLLEWGGQHEPIAFEAIKMDPPANRLMR